MFILCANKTQLTVCRREPITSGSVNVYRARFRFSPDWEGMTRKAVFIGSGEQKPVLLDENGECDIPWETVTKHGGHLLAGVYGTKDDTVLPTIRASLGIILKGTPTGGEPSKPPTPGLWEQELARKGDALDYDGLNLSLMSGDKPLSTVQISGGGGGKYVPVPGPKGDKGDPGPQGVQGVPGEQGPAGQNGEGVPAGGSAGQFLAKNSNADYDTHWVDPPEGGGTGGANITTDGTLALKGGVLGVVLPTKVLTSSDYGALSVQEQMENTLYIVTPSNDGYGQEVLMSPMMVSDTLPSPYIASASNVYGAGFEAFRAFDGSAGQGSGNIWYGSDTADGQWIQFDFGTFTAINGISMAPAWANWGCSSPKEFTISGSNDGNNFVPIKHFTNVSPPPSGTYRDYMFDSSAFYRIYRIECGSNYNGTLTASISDIKFFVVYREEGQIHLKYKGQTIV